MKPNYTSTTFRQLGHILQYVHDHTGNKHQLSMLHANNMIDLLRSGASPQTATLAYLSLLTNRATRQPDYPPD